MPDPVGPPANGADAGAALNKPADCPPPTAIMIAERVFYGSVVVIILGIVGYYTLQHERTLPAPIGSMNFTDLGTQVINNPYELAHRIFNDALWFHELWIRWLLTDWGLTFFAAGSAVTAAIKNAYSSKSGVQTNLSRMDLAVAILAVGAVLASTFEAKLHASELADRYRYGDLKLQDAKAQYLYDLSSGKSQTDATKSLYEAWKDAQKYLEGPFAKEKPNQDSSGNIANKSGEKGKNQNAQPASRSGKPVVNQQSTPPHK
jgi:hypothetical protein